MDGKTILVTGGTGSFGQKFTEIILKEYNPKSVRIYNPDKLSEVQKENFYNLYFRNELTFRGERHYAKKE